MPPKKGKNNMLGATIMLIVLAIILVWLAVVAACAVLGVPAVRRRLLSGPVMEWMRHRLPPISATASSDRTQVNTPSGSSADGASMPRLFTMK